MQSVDTNQLHPSRLGSRHSVIMHFKQVLPLALAGLVAAGGKDKGPKGPKGLQLAMHKQHKDYFGVALTPRDDTQEQAIINNRKDFGSVTPENAMK